MTTNSLAQNIVYLAGTAGALTILAGLLLVDIGGIRRVNQFDSVIQKLTGFFIGFVVYFLIGFAIWNWQYYVAFDVEDPYLQSIKDWWLGGSLTGSAASATDPATAPGLNNQQIFIFFLACFAGLMNVLLHFSVGERIKPAAYYVTSAVMGVVGSVLAWMTWGSTGPLTNAGFHDFFGVGFVYVFTGALALVLTMKVGKRVGMYRPHQRIGEYRSMNLGVAAIGVVMVFSGLPFVILSCGFFFDPEALFVPVNMNDGSLGLAVNNLALAWGGGMLAGAAIAYAKKKYAYMLLGPFAGYVAGAPGFDVYEPWEMLLVAMGAPFVAYAVYEWTQRREIDEHKLIPLFLGVGSYALLMVGLLAWGTPQGGYFGLTEGEYAYQNSEINLLWQAIGLAVCIVFGLVTGLILSFILERTTGLRVSEEVEVQGFDAHYWGIVHDVEPQPAATNGAGDAAAVGVGAEEHPGARSTAPPMV